MSGFYIEKKKIKYNSILLDLARIAVIWIAAMMLLYAFEVSIRVEFRTMSIVIAAPFVVALGYFLTSAKTFPAGKVSKKTMMIARIVAVVLGILAFLYWGLPEVEDGIVYCMDGYNNIFSEPDYLYSIGLQESVEELFWVVIPGIFCIAVLFTIILEKKKGFIIIVTLFLVPFGLCVSTNHFPTKEYVVVVAGALVMLSVCRYSERTVTLLGSELIAGLILAILGVTTYQNGTFLQDYKSKPQYRRIRSIAKDLENLNVNTLVDQLQGGNFATDGIGKGDLEGLTKFDPTHEKVAKVVVGIRPKGTVYLKSYVASRYSSKKWAPIDSRGKKELYMLKYLYADDDNQMITDETNASILYRINNQSSDVLSAMENLLGVGILSNITYQGETFVPREDFMVISNRSKEDTLPLIPYGRTTYDVKDEYEISNELFPAEGETDACYYECFSRFNAEAFSKDTVDHNRLDIVGDLSEHQRAVEYSQEEVRKTIEEQSVWAHKDHYTEFVQKNYLDYPKESQELNQLAEKVRQKKQEDHDRRPLREYIEETFSEGFTYTRKPETNPSGEDFVDFFLRQKQGFCVHFASAATLLYREMGVPCRYVEGYAIPEEAFVYVEASDEYVVEITSDMAHAWCEIYDDYMGWIPRDHTPAEYQYDITGQKPPQQETTTKAVTTTQEETKTKTAEVTTEINNPTEKTHQNASKEIIREEGKTKIPIVILLSGLFAVGAVIAQYFARVSRKRARFRKTKGNLGVRYIVQEMFQVAGVAGVDVKGCSEKEAFERMRKQLPGLEEEEWSWIYENGLLAAFSNQKTESQQRRELERLLNKLKRSVWTALNPVKKLLFKVLYAL